MNQQSIPCSVQVVTRNNAAGIKKCLDSLTMFDEVIVQDGFSTDGTREVAGSYPNVRMMDQNKMYLNDEGRIVDFASMRNESINAAKYDWVFVVDGDEHVDSALIENVRQVVAQNTRGVYQAFRRFYVDGKPIMHSALYPALQIRLFHRTLTEGYVKPVHERLKLKPGVSMQMLTAELPVPLPPARELQPKFDRYLRMEVSRHGVMPWAKWLKWVFLRNLRSIAGLTAKILWIWLIPRSGKRLPLSYELQYIRHSWRTLVYTCPPVAKKFLIASHTSSI
jgi:glycosyltransferase involved in cell wall biosynthesis